MPSNQMTDWLSQFDDDYGKAEGHDGTTTDYSELPDGEYEVQCSGVGWRDYRNPDKEGFSGMGPIWRLRVTKGPHTGRTEEMLWWLIRLHPARGISQATLNVDAKRFLERDCHNMGLQAPKTITEMPTWDGPQGRCFLLRIKSRTKGDKTHRNLYVQRALDVEAMRAQGFSDFEREVLNDEGRWVEAAAQRSPYTQTAREPQGGGYGAPTAPDQDIPF